MARKTLSVFCFIFISVFQIGLSYYQYVMTFRLRKNVFFGAYIGFFCLSMFYLIKDMLDKTAPKGKFLRSNIFLEELTCYLI